MKLVKKLSNRTILGLMLIGLLSACEGKLQTEAILEVEPPKVEEPPPPSSPPATYACSAPVTVFSNNMNATYVMGQDDFTSGSANKGATTSASGFNAPLGVSLKDDKIFIADTSNNRVLVFNSVPTTNGAVADGVIGQPDFTSSAGSTTGTGMAGPQGIYAEGENLFVSEWTNTRISVWPLTGTSATAVVLGQPDVTSSIANNGGIGADTIKNSTAVTMVGTKVVVTDAGNHRVLIYDSTSLALGLGAEVVIGQPDFVSNATGTATNQLNFPLGVASDGTTLIIVDSYNDRALVYNTLPTTNNASADVVIGGYGTTNATLDYPVSAFYDGTKLFIADRSNHRILIWNTLPSVDSTAADIVLGQADFTSGTNNQCACSTPAVNTLFDPHFLYYDGCQLFVSDKGNNRVLVY